MHTKLIQANIALFEGARLETRRLLDEYIEEQGPDWESDPNLPMVLWLDAQTQNSWEERSRRLHNLVARVEAGDHYVELAREYLHEEEKYQAKIDPRSHKSGSGLAFWGISWWKTVILCVVGGVITLGILSLLGNPGNEVGQEPAAAGTRTGGQGEATPMLLPDNSRPLVADSYTARYPGGILQVLAVEDGSQRIVSTRSTVVVPPVPGARFYALQMRFECRNAICNNPPEATLALQLNTGDEPVPARDAIAVAGQDEFEPIALGRSTIGWVIFEIPSISRVEALLVTVGEGDITAEPTTITVELP